MKVALHDIISNEYTWNSLTDASLKYSKVEVIIHYFVLFLEL